MSDALVQKRAALVSQLTERLTATDAPLSELKELQDRLRLLEGAIASQRDLNDRRPARIIAPMALVALLLTLAATLRVPVVPVSMDLQAASVSVELATRATLGPLALRGISHVEGVAVLESPDAELMTRFAAGHAEGFAVDAGEATLRGLEVPAGAQLTLQSLPLGVQVRVELLASPAGLAAHVDLEMSGSGVLGWGGAARSEQRTLGEGEWLRASTTAAKANHAPAPLVLSLGIAGTPPARIAGLQPTSLRFADRRQTGQAVAEVSSSLEGGTVKLPATGEVISIAAGDWLEIDSFVAERCEVVLGSPMIWRINGSAGGVRLKVGAFERSLMPSWLEYMARHHLAKLLWGSAAVLWGALSWIRGRFSALV